MTSDEEFDGSSLGDNDSTVDQPIEATPQELRRTDEVTAPQGDSRSLWDRRTFFKSAALGTAAVAMYEGGRAVFSPLTAYAHDLSSNPCTAQDVRITGPGVIIDEPCDCPPGTTFPATVEFPVENITGTERYCVALHLVPSESGLVFPDIVLINPATGDSTLPRNATTLMRATIQNFPCGQGTVCFGQPGTVRGKCDPGTCSTIAWNTSPNAAGCTTADQSPSPGQCRHQQICIIGRGATTLDCDTVASGVQDLCAVVCGTTTTVELCTLSDPSFGPFTFTLDGQTFGPTADRCHTFTVGPISETTTLTGTVTDRTGCARSDTVTLTTTAPTASILVENTANCDGVLRLTASVTSGEPCTFTWTDVTNPMLPPIPLGTGATISYGPVLDGTCHTIRVDADCVGECDTFATVTIRQCVTTTTPC